MKLKYLGTAAYEGVPALFCECETCRKSREAGGRNIRTRSQAILDDCLLIDFPADTYMHSLKNGIDLTGINTCIITHDHSDHFYPRDLPARTPGYGVVKEDSLLTIYGTAPAMQKLRAVMEENRLTAGKYLDGKQILPFSAFEAEGYRITPLKADHAPKCDPVVYVIEKSGKSLLYAHDSGVFPEETWGYLAGMDGIFDLVSLDCTGFVTSWRKNHMGLIACGEVRARLMDMGRCDAHTVFCLNHFSHNGGRTYDEMLAEAQAAGFQVSYDGMELVF